MSRRNPGQLSLDVRRYIVRCSGLDPCPIYAPSRERAKYLAFVKTREAGYFPDGFEAFLANGVTARADRRALRSGEVSPELGL